MFKLIGKPKPELKDDRDAIVRVPYADQGLNKIPQNVTDLQALLVGDVLATGFWAARISEIKEEDTVLIIGAGPTGICTLPGYLCPILLPAAEKAFEIISTRLWSSKTADLDTWIEVLAFAEGKQCEFIFYSRSQRLL